MTTNMCSRFSRFGSRQALTLIEVMTALAILSTLLVGMLVAFTKNAELIRRELALRRAITATDALLRKWAQEQSYPPARGSGSVPGTDDLVWQTYLQARQPSGALGLDVVNLEILSDKVDDRSEPILAIQLAVPAIRRPHNQESGT